MKIIKLNRSDFVAKIALTELSDYGIGFESLDIEAPLTQGLIIELFNAAGVKPDISLSKMRVDAFLNGAYICVFVVFRPKRFRVIKRHNSLLLIPFDSNAFTELLSFLYKCKNLPFRIYKTGERHLVQTPEYAVDGICLKRLLTEYGEVICADDRILQRLAEHAECVRDFKPKP